MNGYRNSSAMIALAVGLMSTAPAFAQEAPQEAGSQLEDIVVTAQRREQSLQDVPVTITALSAAAIERSGIQSSQDIAIATPGLTMTTNRNGLVPVLRGIGTQAGFSDGSIAFYVDNVYYASTSGAVMGLNNVERIEVLKGPQGTLFGRNATGGLIHIVTRDPSYTPEVKGSVGYGNYDTWTGSLYATGGLASNVAMDVALYGNYQGNGWGTNQYLGNDVNLRREWAARSKLKIELGDRTTVTLAGDYSENKTDQGTARQVLAGSTARGNVTTVGSIYDTNSDIPFDGGDLFGPGNKSYQYGFSGIVKHELSDSISVTSTTAYRNFNTRSYLDNDLTPAQTVDAFFGEVAKSFQQELLLNGKADRIDWTLGGIYYHSRGGYDPFIILSSIPAQNTSQTSLVTTDSFAIFGQGSYDLTDSTTLTLGGRYTTDRMHIESVTYAAEGNTLPVGTVIADAGTAGQPRSRTHRKWSRPTWRVSLDHKLSSDILAYMSYNRGYKAGAFNPGAPPSVANVSPVGDAVDPEKLDAYEIGVKSDLFDRQVRLNASAFYYDYKNIQLLQLAPDGRSIALFNAGAARVKGVEVEAVFAPYVSVGRLEFRVGTSYLDAKYTELDNAPTNTPNASAPYGNTAGSILDGSGNRMIKTPKFSSSVGLDYTMPVSDSFDMAYNLTWQHNSRIYWEVDNRLSQAPTDIVNAQLSFGPTSEAWRVRLWGRNLTDEQYIATVNSGIFGDGAAAAAPRTYGVTFDFKFGG